MLLNYTNDNLNECIKKESVSIINAISFAVKSKETLSMCIKRLSDEKQKQASSLSKIFAYNIDSLKRLESRLEDLKTENGTELNSKVSEYNALYMAVFHQFFTASSNLQSIMQDFIKEPVPTPIEESPFRQFSMSQPISRQPFSQPKPQTPINKTPEVANETEDNNVLLISEREKKVYLPYKKKNIQNILKESKKYANAADVVDSMYTVPLSKYTNSASARFREGFNLMRKKECGSFIKSVDLGLELLPKYDLNPAVISACQNLDELDIYLDYLDSNELDKFNIFNVKYEVTPTIVKKQNDFS